MCKIFSLIGFNTVYERELADEICNFAAPIICKRDNHGFGYAGYNKQNNKVFTEKYLVPKDSWTRKSKLTDENYKRYGTPEKEYNTILMHSRFATNAKNIENTHPFVRKKTVLIHNGVVGDTNLDHLQSTCDSEGILNAYVDLNISHKPSNFKYLYNSITGWYACCVLSRHNGKAIVDVFKNNGANLSEVRLRGRNGFILCTDPNHAKTVATLMFEDIESISDVLCDTIIRYDADNGELLNMIEVKDKINSNKSRFGVRSGWDNWAKDWDDYDYSDMYSSSHIAKVNNKTNKAKSKSKIVQRDLPLAITKTNNQIDPGADDASIINTGKSVKRFKHKDISKMTEVERDLYLEELISHNSRTDAERKRLDKINALSA